MQDETLVIQITDRQIVAIKSDLLHSGRQIPQIKSSHLTEALARALGFSKQASLKATFVDETSAHFVEFHEEAFWTRLSELSGLAVPPLKESFPINLPRIVAKVTGTRDFRYSSPSISNLSNQLDHLFSVMAEHGVGRYFCKVGRTPSGASLGLGGFYRMSAGTLRPAFQHEKEGWEGHDAHWDAVIADDILTENINWRSRDITSWASTAGRVIPFDVELRTVVFSAELGLFVEHGEIDGCEMSILHQRKGQLAHVRTADARKLREKSSQAV